MDTNKVESLKELLIDVRKAHRLVYSFQERMLSLVNFIRAHLDFHELLGVKHYSNTMDKVTGAEKHRMPVDMWAWDFIYSYVFEYFIGSMNMDDGSTIQLSIVQYADTGFFDSETEDRRDISHFAAPKDSASKIMFVMEHTPKGKKQIWKDWADLRPYIMNKEYASSKHQSSELFPNGQGKTRLLLYSMPLERFVDERSSIESLKEYLAFLKKKDIILDLV